MCVCVCVLIVTKLFCFVLDSLIYFLKQNENLNESNLNQIIEGKGDKLLKPESGRVILFGTNKKKIKAHTLNQIKIIEAFENNDMVFAIGPAGTGKTFLAVACAVNALEKRLVKKIILVRPAIEAGEKLGFLPGDLAEKIDPYLQPLYDSLYECLGFETVNKLLEKKVIEIAPLAYMRGRTLNDAFIILDEAQNTTISQMQMFLTRIGYGSTTVVTGDVSQIDLPKDSQSGLKDCLEFILNIKGIDAVKFGPKDVMRHKIVSSIVSEYEKRKKNKD